MDESSLSKGFWRVFSTVMVSHGVVGKPISVTERDKLESAKCYVTDSECFA